MRYLNTNMPHRSDKQSEIGDTTEGCISFLDKTDEAGKL